MWIAQQDPNKFLEGILPIYQILKGSNNLLGNHARFHLDHNIYLPDKYLKVLLDQRHYKSCLKDKPYSR